MYMNGRLWVDGLDDPLRGSHFTTAIDGQSQVWQVIASLCRGQPTPARLESGDA